MNKIFLTAIIGALSLYGFAQQEPVEQTDTDSANSSISTEVTAPTISDELKITVEARNRDAREVLHDVFSQARKDYIIEQTVKGNLFLAFYDSPFEKAITLICDNSGLKYTVTDGVYIITLNPQGKTAAKPVKSALFAPVIEDPLLKIVSLNITKKPIGEVAVLLGEQTGATITVESNVPGYLVSMLLTDKPLRFALTALSAAAPVAYDVDELAHIHIRNKTANPSAQTIENNKAVTPTAVPEFCCGKCGKSVLEDWRWCPHCGKFLTNPKDGKR